LLLLLLRQLTGMTLLAAWNNISMVFWGKMVLLVLFWVCSRV
jgi:hypothetical protein